MRLIPLTQGQFAIVDDIDYERVSLIKWYAHRHKRRRNAKWYAYSRNSIKMHRWILQITDPEICVDHKDGNGLNNTRNNLRIATTSQNQANSTKVRGGASKFKGVYWSKWAGKWRAQIGFNGQRKHLGTFQTESEAADAYNLSAKDQFGEFSKLNEIS